MLMTGFYIGKHMINLHRSSWLNMKPKNRLGSGVHSGSLASQDWLKFIGPMNHMDIYHME